MTRRGRDYVTRKQGGRRRTCGSAARLRKPAFEESGMRACGLTGVLPAGGGEGPCRAKLVSAGPAAEIFSQAP